MKRLLWTAAVLGLAMAGPLAAAELGRPASALQIEHWIKGKALDLSAGKGKTIYVVDFWATWCAPCQVSIPHLTELRKKYAPRGVDFVGISDEPVDRVRPFVERLGTKMDYAVGVDTTGATHATYLEAYGVRGVPRAFVVDKLGNVAWHGQVMTGLDRVLEEMLTGRFDPEAAKRSLHAESLVTRYFALSRLQIGSGQAKELGEQIVREASHNPPLLNEFAWTILSDKDTPARDLDLALRAAKLAYDRTAGNEPAIVDTYARALFCAGRKTEAIRLQKAAIALCRDPLARAQLQAALEEYQKDDR
jgi:thiol-disulfide isomerase/thioredoxin